MDWTLEVVVVPVSDLDRAKTFYADQVGFGVDLDHRISDDVRIIQLTPPGSACSISLTSGMHSMAPGSLQGLQLCVPDIEAAHAQLAQRGVPVGEIVHFEGAEQVPGKGGRWNSFVFFADPDGNAWAVQEKPAE